MTKAIAEKKYTVSKDTKFDGKANLEADHAMRELDRVKRWKKVHDLLRKQNKKARKEQDKTAEDAKYFRENGLVKSEKTSKLGLRWGVSLPPMTYNAIVATDRLVNGKSDLADVDKENYRDGIKGSNELVKDLEKAFPQYKVAK